MARPSNREKVLDAFERVLIDRGAADATVEAVATEAGVSKGGLLYHFGTKDELFAAFGDRLLARIDAAIADAPGDPAEVVRWYLDASPAAADDRELWQTILAALRGAESELADVIRAAFDRYAEPLAVLGPPVRSEVRLIGDGLFLGALVGMDPPGDLDRIVEDLIVRLAPPGTT